MLPIRCEKPGKGFPTVTVLLVLACGGVFAFQWYARLSGGLVPLHLMGIVFHPERGLHHALLAITVAFFMHGGLFHLLSNMWYLWIFGALTERHIGGLSFLTVYVACGIMSMVIEVASTPLSTVPLVGASGAIAGIMGVTLVLLPLSRILVWIPPVFVVPIPAFIFLLLWFGIQYVNVGRDPAHGGGIAWWAHIGGYLTGVVAAFFIRKEGAGKRGRRNA